MTIATTLQVAASSSLATLNTIVSQQEGVHGPLSSIGNDGSSTLLTFQNTPNKPGTPATIAQQNGGTPIIPAGAALICTGTIFIAGAITLAAATR